VGVANFFLDQSIGIDENNTLLLKLFVRVGVANFFLDQSIGIDENNTLLLKLF